MWELGYKYAWKLAAPYNFVKGLGKNTLKITEGTGTIWTNTDQAPKERIPRALKGDF